MPLNECARPQCQFPIESNKITCQKCGGVFHPNCSDLSPEQFNHKLSDRDWICSVCTSLISTSSNTEVIGDTPPCKRVRDERPHFSTIAYVTGNKNKIRETVEILGEEYAGMVSIQY